MANQYYDSSGTPAQGSSGASAPIRNEYALIQAGFDKLPSLSGNANQTVVVNSTGTALTTAAAGQNTISTTGNFTTVFAQQANTTLILPPANGTLVTEAGVETLSNKTFIAPALGTPLSGTLTNCTGTAAGLTAGHVTTNANLTGPIASSGNTTSITAQTGTGTTFVMQASPTLTTPNLGTPSAGVLTSCTGTAAGLTAGLATSVAGGSAGQLHYQSSAGVTAFLATGGSARQLLMNQGSGLAPAWTAETYGSPSGLTGYLLASDGTNWVATAPTAQSAASAENLTGTFLAANVTASSLISFGAGIALGTPASGNLTNCTGNASGLTVGNVTTNANLTGPIKSTGNTTSVTSQTGTGTTFVMQSSPTLSSPALGTPSSGNLSNCSGNAASLTVGNATAAVTATTLSVALSDSLGGTGATKTAWAFCSVSGGAVTVVRNHNISSVTYDSVGNYTVNFTANFANTNYAVFPIAGGGGSIFGMDGPTVNRAAGSCLIFFYLSTTGAGADPATFNIWVMD